MASQQLYTTNLNNSTTHQAIFVHYSVLSYISGGTHLFGWAVDSDRFPPGGHAVGGRLRIVASR